MTRILSALLTMLLACATSFAQAPEVSLAARLTTSGTILTVSLTPSASTAGCTYSLYGSADKSVFASGGSGGRLLSLFPAAPEITKRRARDLSLVRRAFQGRPKAYLRAHLQCTGEQSLSPVVTVILKTSASGVGGAGAWLREVSTTLRATRIKLSKAFPKLTFSSPLALVSPADGTKRLFVVEQGGKIFVIKNSPAAKSKALFLDLSSRISRGGELGLLGLAFHPSFAENGKFYVNYTEPRSPGSAQSRSVISEFTRSSASSTDLSSERRLMELDQPFSNHNGGDLAFGPDGFLYIGFGDGGSGGDPQGNGQDRSVLLGKILRIDIDAQEGSLAYAIPNDNPFKGNSSGFREEIFAYGFRNPFRISFDQETGRLWAGDVGQGAREEIDLVLSGGNYGWNTMEGSQCYPPEESCNTAGLVLPITEYGHDVGRSIIGGYVFSGRSIPNLRGHYIFGDFVTGIIFSLLYDGATATRKTLLQSGLSIASFGRDEDGEIYVVSYGDGKIYKIVPR